MTTVVPLPVSADSPAKKQLNETNNQLYTLMAQTQADAKYDPPPPQPLEKPSKEGFSSPNILAVIGLIFIAYGVIAK